ncbi:MAG: DUF1570 domain-containing protein [bacterium]|nr:DUF1570 domain-containing protein [bacterium]
MQRPKTAILTLSLVAWLPPAAQAVLPHGQVGEEEPQRRQTSRHGHSDVEESLVEALEEATRHANEGNWKRTRKILDAAVAAAGEADCVWRHRPQLVELLTRCAFWEGRKVPRLRDLVSGRVLYFSESGGNIKLAYGPDELGDFEILRDGERSKDAGPIGVKDILVHPLSFAGPFRVTIKSSRYPSMADERCPWALYGFDGGESIRLIFGLPKPNDKRVYKKWIPGRIQHEKPGGHIKNLCRKDDVPCRPGSKFTLKIKADEQSTTGSYNGKVYLRGRKPKGLFGSVAIGGLREFDEIMLEGKAERAWMQGLIDEELQGAWDAFEQAGRVDAALPEFLRLPDLPWEVQHTPDVLPGDASDVEQEQFGELLEMLDENVSAGVRFAKDLDADETSEPFRKYAQAVAYMARGLEVRTLRRVKSLLEAHPDFIPARKMRAQLLRGAGEHDEAEALLQELIDGSPQDGWAYAHQARHHVREGERAKASELVGRAIEAGAYDGHVDLANRLIGKALRGPAFHDAAEHVSENYVVRSDIDKRTCREASKILESALPWYERAFGEIPKGKRFDVYVFSGPYGYHRYIEDAFQTVAPNTAGVYWLELDQLLIWNTPKRAKMLSTIRHEGFHQYMDQLVKGGPLWFHEGLAEYWEEADFTRMKSRHISVREDYVRFLTGRKVEMTPLAEFLHQSHAEFRSDSRLHYAQAWALVHFLRHGPEENQAIFERLLVALKNGTPTEKALDQALEGVNVEALEKGLNDYLRSLL